MTEISMARRTRVTVMEDNPGDIELLRMAIAGAHFDCEMTVVGDGGEAMARVQDWRSGRVEPPDLLVLDLNLPKSEGLEILAAIRAERRLQGLPVAVLSSSSSQRDKQALEHLGIAAYLTKPADLDEYLDIGGVLKQLALGDARKQATTP
ncbi:MAG: response regulator [Bryobacteraceae bacterium]|nr:response regulator [Bryobacteraceae bacterium]